MGVRLPPLAAWQALRDDPDAIAATSEVDRADVAAVERLRRRWKADVVAAGLCLAEGRSRLRGKFSDAERLWADGESAQQASSRLAADWKARRFHAAGGPIDDLCSGMGGDAMSLATGGTLRAVDQSEVRAWMTGLNAGCATVVADAGGWCPLGLVHIDPSRRDEAGGSRVFDPARLSPTLGACLALVRSATGGAIKVGPGIRLPVAEAADGEVEFLSEGGILVQAVLWFGALARQPGGRTASLLHSGLSRTGVASVAALASGDFDRPRWLLVPDPSVERAGLLADVAAECEACELAPGLGILVSGGNAAPASPWLAGYEILARPRPREADVAAALRELGAGSARVRTRGKSADADAWTKALRIGGGEELDVFLLRVGNRREAFVAREV